MKRHLLLLSIGLAAACSTSPSAPDRASQNSPKSGGGAGARLNGIALAPVGDREVRTAAAGDVKNGPLEILRVRVRQGSNGFYATAGGNYSVVPAVPVEMWVEWSADTPQSTVPRLVIDWSATQRDNIHCGPCLLTNTYAQVGVYTVTVTLDDRISGVTRRTFTLNVAAARPVPQVNTVSEVDYNPGWMGTFRVSYAGNAGVTVNLRSIRWFRADTRAQVGSQGDLLGWTAFKPGGLPDTYSIGGGLDCGTTGGARGYFTWTVELVADDGATSSTSFQSISFGCYDGD